jgi:nitric oxide reductase subunit B
MRPSAWWNRWVMSRRGWWLPLALVLLTGLGGMLYVGMRTYADAPPIPDFVTAEGAVVIAADDIRGGQRVFLRHGLMNYGSMFGDGATRGPDFTADALRQTALAMRIFHLEAATPGSATESGLLAVADDRTRRELRANTHDPATNRVVLAPSQVAAIAALEHHYGRMFGTGGSVSPQAWVPAESDRALLARFFFWGAWVCASARPGVDYSYTHNWPYDPLAGNVPTPAILVWTVISTLGLVLALGLILYLYGRYSQTAGWRASLQRRGALAAATAVEAFVPSRTQRAAYPFFAAALALFVLQIVAGVLTVHDFLGLTFLGDLDLRSLLPITVTRGWHLQLALLWISACWIGASIFVLSGADGAAEPPGQTALARLLFALVVLLVAGMLGGVYAGPMGLLGENWRLLGSQGWEFMELGRLWQLLMFVVFALWLVFVARAVRPLWHRGGTWSLPRWLLYTVAAVLLLSLSGFVAGPDTNFVIADFWRWAVIHMWVEAFFEVFATVILAWFLVMLGFVSRAAASRVVYLAALLFLGSGLLGISHNFYWNAKPVATLAIGGVFSTLQVVPLVLLTLEAWSFARLPQGRAGRRPETFGQREAFTFLLAMNFWNFFGAGVFGFIINLPIVNYYEHGTYLTVNHGHAALMGVYGNLALGAALFCARCLLRPERWNAGLVRRAFWSLNLGLVLMVLLDLFPAGVHQLMAVLDHGLAAAREEAFIQGDTFQALTWARVVGGALFVLGGVLPLAWFFLSRLRSLRTARP